MKKADNSPKNFWQQLGWVSRSRPLTGDEQALVRSVFGNQIDLSLPRICISGWILHGYAMSPNGNVYFNRADFKEDFSKASLGVQAWFIHEMTHVWQVQQGIQILRRAVLDRRYQYVLQAGKQFLDYGVEQQAQMVQDYFLRRALGQDCKPLAACLPFVGPDNGQHQA